MTNKFINPYQGLDNDSLDERGSRLAKRMQTYIAKGDYQFVQCLRPGNGTITIVVNTLFKKLVEALKANKIRDLGDIEAFESFVAECEITGPMKVKAKKGVVQHVEQQ